MINLIHGDCLEKMKDIPDNSVDMILTDPPYGKIKAKWDCVIDIDAMWVELLRLSKPNSVIALFGIEPFSSYLRVSNINFYKYDWVWDKVKSSGFQIAKYKPMARAENISIFCNGIGKIKSYNPQMEKREKIKKSKCYSSSDSNPLSNNDNKQRFYSSKYPTNIIKVSNANQKGKVHPTQKPVDLLEYLIKTYSNKNETVLDFTMGSGSTGIACLNTGRNFIGIEKDDHYFQVAKNRIENHQPPSAVF